MRLKFNKKDIFFVAVVALVHLLYFLLACHYKKIYMGDSYEYVYEASNIKQNLFFYSGNPALTILPEYMTQRQPLYPLLLSLVYALSGSNWWVIVLQQFISLFSILYVARLCRSWLGEQKVAWLYLLLVVALPSQFINAATIAPDILLQLFAVLYFGAALRYFTTGAQVSLGMMSLWLIAGMLVKPVLYPFAFVHFLWFSYHGFRSGKFAISKELLLLLPIAAVLLYSGWNYTRTGKFHYSSNQAFNALFYYKPYIAEKYGVDSAAQFVQAERQKTDALPAYSSKYSYANERGKQLFWDNFPGYLLFHIKGSLRIFVDPGKAEMDLFCGRLTYGSLFSNVDAGFWAVVRKKGLAAVPAYIAGSPTAVIALLVLLGNLLKAIGLLLFFLYSSVRREVKYFSILFIYYFALAAGPIAHPRYLLPVSLLLAAFAAIGYKAFMEQRSKLKTD